MCHPPFSPSPALSPLARTLVEFYELINKRQELRELCVWQAQLKLQPFCQLLLLLLLLLLIMWIIRGICLAARVRIHVYSEIG